ncbi:hypothetical protein [Anoxybacter fermentans]|uniref:hypothetical protein n=1 Tax=Anoxybacter fermentans TaxID=1323375 RepID=UPI000F8E1E70
MYSLDGQKPEEFATPTGIAIQGEFLYVADSRNNRIQKYRINHEALDQLEKEEK